MLDRGHCMAPKQLEASLRSLSMALLECLQRRGLTFHTRVIAFSNTVERVECFRRCIYTYIDDPNSDLLDRQHSLQQQDCKAFVITV